MVLQTYKGEIVTAGMVDVSVRKIFKKSKGFLLRRDYDSITKWKVTGVIATSLLTNSVVGIALQKGANFILCLESGLENSNSILSNSRILEVCYKNDILVYEIGSPWSMEPEIFYQLLSKLTDNDGLTFFTIPEITMAHVVIYFKEPIPLRGIFDRLIVGAITFSQKSVSDHDTKRAIILEKFESLDPIANLGIDCLLTFQLNPELMSFSRKNKILSIIVNHQQWLNEFLRIIILEVANKLGCPIIPVFELSAKFRVL
ncbi:MAG: hypothetical protein D6732_10705 [Methanobacteriota archaeon]|nr:MAG: hypothetical protein D6732_10705 [Euryarchaeota archaeon]